MSTLASWLNHIFELVGFFSGKIACSNQFDQSDCLFFAQTANVSSNVLSSNIFLSQIAGNLFLSCAILDDLFKLSVVNIAVIDSLSN